MHAYNSSWTNRVKYDSYCVLREIANHPMTWQCEIRCLQECVGLTLEMKSDQNRTKQGKHKTKQTWFLRHDTYTRCSLNGFGRTKCTALFETYNWSPENVPRNFHDILPIPKFQAVKL